MLVSELKAKCIKRGIHYNKWLPVYKFIGAKVILWVMYPTDKIEVNLTEIERIEA